MHVYHTLITAMKKLSISNLIFCYIFQIFEIPFYVAIDKGKQSVVLAIRGTLSLKVSYQ